MTTLKCACPACKKILDTKPEYSGKAVRCPGCKKVFKLPSLAAESRLSETPKIESCPLCTVKWKTGALACGDCGFMPEPQQISEKLDQILCINPPCGALNDSSRTTCHKCSSPLPCSPGKLFKDRYQIDSLLAMGGFGAVYRGTDLADGTRIAIKEMLCADKGQFNLRLNFFRREAEILKALANQTIVPKLFDYIEFENSAYIIMEFIHGKDFLKILELTNNRPFSVDEVSRWGCAVCEVIDAMHRNEPPFIHRDIKPDNLILLDDRSGIRMIDFGTARDLRTSGPDGQKAKTRIYTEGYAPPEQVVGRPEVRSDLFALAGTLYHLVSGKCPEGTSTGKEIKSRLEGKIFPPFPEDDKWFWEIIRVNLEEDPSDRYFSARELSMDLANKKISKEKTCHSCATNNPVRTPYCHHCAAELTDQGNACPDCGKCSRMGCRYCIQCGGRIR